VTVVDTSVVVAAFASWHAQHAVADSVVDGKARLVAHCAVEAFSVLTRLPPPHRVAAPLVRDFLAARFPEPYVVLPADEYRALVPRLVELGVNGGAAYDALVAATARAAGETLVSCDRRAAQTYERVGVDFGLLA
jgi:predicted nucleic acid-binding protein